MKAPEVCLDMDFLSETSETSAAEVLVFVLGVRRSGCGSAAAVRLVEGSQRAVFVAVEGSASLQDFAAHPAPRAVLSRSRGAHGVRRAQERPVAPRVRDVAVRGLLPHLLRAPGPRLFLPDFLILG